MEIISEPWGLCWLLMVWTLNLTVSWWERHWAKKLNSAILYADAQHTLVDVITTVFVIVSWQLSTMGYVWLDKLCAIGVACLVLYFAFGLYQKVVPILVDGFAIDPKLLSQATAQVIGVKEVRQVRSRWIGDSKAVDLIIAVDAKLNITGNSFPENAQKFYLEISQWLGELSQKSDSIEINCDINYMASSSLISFLDLLKKCESKFGSENCILNWNFESDDDDAEKTGEDFSKIVSMTINLLPY